MFQTYRKSWPLLIVAAVLITMAAVAALLPGLTAGIQLPPEVLGAAPFAFAALGTTDDYTATLEILKKQDRELSAWMASERKRLDEIEKRMNRPGYFTEGRGFNPAKLETEEQRKALDAGVRALLMGNQAEADRQFKGMSVGSDADGGYLVTPTFSSEMTKIILETAPIIAMARTVEIEGDRFEEPEDINAAGASWVGEEAERGDTATPKVGLFDCPVHELVAQPKATQKLLDTQRYDVVGWLQGKVGEAFGNAEADAFINGNGVAKPRGFLTYPTAATGDATRAWGTIEHVITGASGAFKAANADPADCLIETVAKLKPQFRAGAVWVMNRQTEAAVRKLKDTQGRFLLVDSLMAGQPKQLLGYPVVEAEQMPDIAANSLSIAFGDFRRAYTVVRRLGVRFLVDPYTNKPNVRLYSYARVGGAVNNFQAIKLVRFTN